MRIVIDTNVLVSRALFKNSIPAKAVRYAENNAEILYSHETFNEIRDVILRPKFRPYINENEIINLLAHIQSTWIDIPILHKTKACRDPKDDKFLDLALNGNATHILTGDEDLLTLNPFKDISILTPADFLFQIND